MAQELEMDGRVSTILQPVIQMNPPNRKLASL